MSRGVRDDTDKLRAREVERISRECTGAYSCTSPAHIEGCFATDERIAP